MLNQQNEFGILLGIPNEEDFRVRSKDNYNDR